MKLSFADTRNIQSFGPKLAALALAGMLLAGCETTGSGTGAQAEMKTPEPPMTHRRAAEQCWMATEKGYGSASLDKRADMVTKCIDDKMKGAPAAPKS